jgi:group I intron endonuclease
LEYRSRPLLHEAALLLGDSMKNIGGYIYMIRNLLNGKVYIGNTGYTPKARFKQHCIAARKGSKCSLHRAMRKYGIESFEVLELHLCFTTEELDKMEIVAIASYKSNSREFGYNMTEGGDGITNPSEERRRQQSEFMKKRGIYPGMLEAAIAANTGKVCSEETRRKISEANRGIPRPHSEAWRKAVSETLKRKGHMPSRETIERARLSRLGSRASEATRQKQSDARRGKYPSYLREANEKRKAEKLERLAVGS